MSPSRPPADDQGAPFTGFPPAALDFYDDLELDNTRSFWQAHQQVYADAVRAPMLALTEALAPEFGPAKVYRPYRDVRFSKDKTPYKEHQGAIVSTSPSTGWYVQVAAPGVRVGAGSYRADGPDLARIRAAIGTDHSGRELEGILDALTAAGFEVGGEKLRTTPRGWSADHPRIELLRHTSLFVGRSYGFEPFIHTPELLDHVREDWRRLRPLVEWLTARTSALG